MPRPTVLLLVLTMVIVSGCAGVFGGQDTATPTVAPTDDSTDTPARTPAKMSMNDQPYTLFSGAIANSGTSGSHVFMQGDPVSVTINITNSEGQRINYTTVLQVVRRNGTSQNTAITERRTLDTFTTPLKAGENRVITRNITPTMTGQNLLLIGLLYESDPPATATFDNSHEYFAIPVTITNSSSQANRSSGR